jgi:hypothetical protein
MTDRRHGLQVAIDPNMRTAQGFVPAFAAELPTGSDIGDVVTVVESETGVRADARVAEIRDTVAYLDVIASTVREGFEATSIGTGSAVNASTVRLEAPLAA